MTKKNETSKQKKKRTIMFISIIVTAGIAITGILVVFNLKTTPPASTFISTWDTTRTSAGSSLDDQVKLPLDVAGT
ncbi:MAG: hypothetical protein ACTSXP_00045 [Promethearchaeota archaeon]